MTTDPYEILGVPPEATLAEIEARYRLLLRRHHPDVHHAEGEDAVAAAQARTQQLTWAMDVIRGKVRPGRAAGWGPAAGGTPGATGGSSGPGARPGSSGHGSDQWVGANPFWRSGSEPDGGGPSADDPPWAEYDWFGHRVDQGPDGPVPCPFCGRPFDDLAVYEQHLERSHHYRQVTVKRRQRPPSRFWRYVGALRFIPAWLVTVLTFLLLLMFGIYAFLAGGAFLALVLWTQTTPRFRGRRS